MKLTQKSLDLWYFLEKKFLPEELKGRDTLITWKERVLYLSCLCLVIFGLFALIPSLILAYQKGLMVVFSLDIFAYGLVVFFLFSKKLPLKTKFWITLIIIYLLGITLLFATGYYGAGYIWLFAASLFAGLLLDNKHTVFLPLINLFVLLLVGAYILFGSPPWPSLLEHPMEIWMILTVNFMVVTLLMTVVGARAKRNIDEAVSRQIEAQKNLIEEKDFSDYVIQSIPGLFFLFEKKDDQLLMKRWNENISVFFGYSHEELKDMNSFQLFEEKDHPSIIKQCQKMLDKGFVSYEIEVIKKDRTATPVYVQARSFKKNNRLYVVGNAMDISESIAEAKEKETMQRSLAISQKASALGTLSSGIAHDFNNILSGIIGYTTLIRMAPNDLKNVDNGVTQILKGSERARELVQQILTFSRQTESEKRATKLYLILKEAVKFMRSSIPASIEIKEKIESRAFIYADATQIHQVIMNLCTNAYHAMKKTGGALTVELSEIQISKEDQFEGHKFIPGKYLLIMIADTGHGMNKPTLDRIFEPYFTTKETAEGTGLGLSVVQGIIKEHQGHIQVDSRINEGTVFYLYFPVLDKTKKIQAPKEDLREPVVSQNSERILVAEDENSIRFFMQSAFEDYGYYVETFPNGEDAFKKFSENPDFFDLVITDAAMPKMTGNQLIEEILKIREDMPIIMQTGYTETYSEETAHQNEIKRYLQKPTDIKDIILAAQDVLKPS